MAVTSNRDLAQDFFAKKQTFASTASAANIVIPAKATTVHVRFSDGGWVFQPGIESALVLSTNGEKLEADEWGSFPISKYADGEQFFRIRNFGASLGTVKYRFDLTV